MHKLLASSVMSMLILFVYCILKSTKDAVVIHYMGAELISTLKLFGTLPSAFLIMLFYTRLSDSLSRLNLYYLLITIFIVFFWVFIYVLSPNASSLHVDLSHYQEQYPRLKYIFIMLSNWSYSLFYIMAEMWGSTIFALMFWQLANQINTVEQAKASYPYIALIGQFGMAIAGISIWAISKNISIQDDWQSFLEVTGWLITLGGVLLMVSLWYLSNFVVDKKLINAHYVSESNDGKKKGFFESLKHIFSSYYIALISLLVICYGICINVLEGVWKKQINIHIKTPTEIAVFMGGMELLIGLCTIMTTIIGAYLLKRYSWKVCAVITPIITAIGGGYFFIAVLFPSSAGLSINVIGMTFVNFTIIAGAAQVIITKSVKYALFESTKEISFIPLDDELKSKGKGVVELVGARLGKSGGAVMQFLLLSFIVGSDLSMLAPELFAIFLIFALLWVGVVFLLSKQFELKSKESNA